MKSPSPLKLEEHGKSLLQLSDGLSSQGFLSVVKKDIIELK
jgi:hypothetical protein